MALRHAEWTKSTRTAPAAHSVNLGKTYGTGQAAVQALAGVTVAFPRGRFTAVMGLVPTLTAAPSCRPPASWRSFLAALLGLLAATWPARRAARLDVLAAIAVKQHAVAAWLSSGLARSPPVRRTGPGPADASSLQRPGMR